MSQGKVWKRRVVKLVAGACGAVLLVALLEGVVSLAYVAHLMATKTKWKFGELGHPLATRFDADLGWCSNPGYDGASREGHAGGQHITAQGFRGKELFDREIPAGRVRALASGDSFTFGTGASDEANWCAGLSKREPRLQVVNLGVGGYGIDQAYLRYRRDGATLDHDLHFFAFITEDVLRAVIPATWGAPKPRLLLEGNELQVQGVPVQRIPSWQRTFRQASGFLEEMRLVQAARHLAGQRPRPNLSEDAEARALGLAIFEQLSRLAKERDCELVLIHLPVESERFGGSVDVLRLFFQSEAKRLGIGWIDLLDEFRALPVEQHASLYLHKPAPGVGHYSASGHAFVADVITRKLRDLPAVRAKLEGAP